MTLERQLLGVIGEEIAVRELIARGYAILERRYRSEYGEIDIVAEDDETIVFVEVRARATEEFGTAAESITDGKKRRVTRMAADYLTRRRIGGRACRFDVVAVDNALGNEPVVTVYPAAFDAMGV